MKMKIRIAVATLALATVFFGCSQQIEASGARETPEERFRMEHVASDWNFDVYLDLETGVQYIVYEDYGIGGHTWFGIVPRYNADGSLYVGG